MSPDMAQGLAALATLLVGGAIGYVAGRRDEYQQLVEQGFCAHEEVDPDDPTGGQG